jgi:signal transduction histidine kinase
MAGVHRRKNHSLDAALMRLASAERVEGVYAALLEAAVAMGFPRGLVLEADFENGRFGPVATLGWPGARLNAFRSLLRGSHELAGLFHRLKVTRLVRSSLHEQPLYFHPMIFSETNFCSPAARSAAGCAFAGARLEKSTLEMQKQVCGSCRIRGFAAALVVELPGTSVVRLARDLDSLVHAANQQLSRLHWIKHARHRLEEAADLRWTGRELLQRSDQFNAVGEFAGHERELQRNLMEMEKFAATGRLAATIAHEINNPMETIKNAIYMMSGWMPDNAMPYFNILKSETERVARIVRQMLGLYRNKEQVRPVNINAIIADATLLFSRPLQQANIKVRSQLGELPDTVIAAEQISQVMSNLILNARDAMPEGGSMRIRSRYLPPQGKNHGWVKVLVADTGTGIHPELVPSIFDPFITTKGERGTGLGLWIVKGIIQSHAGKLSVKSRLGKGTVFKIELPAGKLWQDGKIGRGGRASSPCR